MALTASLVAVAAGVARGWALLGDGLSGLK